MVAFRDGIRWEIRKDRVEDCYQERYPVNGKGCILGAEGVHSGLIDLSTYLDFSKRGSRFGNLPRPKPCLPPYESMSAATATSEFDQEMWKA